jgi:cytochrome c
MLNLRTFAFVTVLAGGAVALQSPATAADAAHGEQVFNKCKQCHTLEEGKKRIGPSLAGVVGRPAGSVDGYRYSQAMIEFGESGKVWDEALLDSYLEKPREVVAKTKMIFAGLKEPADRADVIAYLQQFSQ